MLPEMCGRLSSVTICFAIFGAGDAVADDAGIV